MRVASVLFLVLFLGLAVSGCLEGPPGAAPEEGGGNPGLEMGPDSFVATLKDGSLADLARLGGIVAPVGEERFIGAASFEPTIGITASGAIFMVAFGGGPRVRASVDEGATWRQVSAVLPAADPRSGNPLDNPPSSNDPFVYVDRVAGRVFTSDLQALLCSWMNFSDDEGRTWATNPVGCGHPFGVHDHQSLSSGPSRTGASQWKGRVVYYCVNRVVDTACASSMDGGASFGLLVPAFSGIEGESGEACGGLSGHVKTDHAGRVFLAKSQCGVPAVAISEDDGRTWRTVAVPGGAGVRGHDVEIAVDEADNVYAFWIAADGRPLLSLSRDHGRSFGEPWRVAAPEVTAAALPAVAAAGPGRVAFAYLATNRSGGFSDAGAAWGSAKWHGYLGVITEAVAGDPLILTTRIDSAQDPLAVRECVAGGDDRCNGMGDFIDLTIDPKGRPWAAFVDVCHETCRVRNQNESARGAVGTLREGPSLLASGGALPRLVALPLAPPAGAR